MSKIKRRNILAGASSIGLVSAFGIVSGNPMSSSGPASGTYDADAVTVDADIGEISVTGENRDDIELTTEIDGDDDDIEVDATTTNNELVVTVEDHYSCLFWCSPPDVEIDLKVPKDLDQTEITATNGLVTVTDVDHDVTANTDNGNIVVENVGGEITGETTNGSIDLTDVEAIGDLSTYSGQIDAEVETLETDATVETTNGNITLVVGDEFDATVSAEADTGLVSIEGDDINVQTQRYDYAEATFGDGTYSLDVFAERGEIEITDDASS